MARTIMIYTLIDTSDDNAIISTDLCWEEVIALVDHLNLENWDVIEHEIDIYTGKEVK